MAEMSAEAERKLRKQIYDEGQDWHAQVAQAGGRLPTSDEMDAIALDILAGRPGPKNEPKYLRVQREMIAKDIEEIKAKGGVVEIPSSIP